MKARIRVEMARDENDFGMFCAAMNKLLGCGAAPHCQATCWARALFSVQRACDKGETVGAAVKEWATSGIRHKDGEEILADILGVKDMGALRKVLAGETT